MTTARLIAARPELERFYHDVTASALNNKLSDGELCAILSMIIGRMVGASKIGEDRTTIQDTALYNITQGRNDIPALLEALGKGN